MLSVEIKHQLGAFALDARFEAPEGITVLFGRSGAGKTTIINTVAGLMTPASGRILSQGRTLLDTATGVFVPPHARRVGYIFQEARLFPHLTVAQNLSYGAWFAKTKKTTRDYDRIVETLGIGALLDRRPARLSGGERQRVAIGRALLAHPSILLADEPLAALDAERKAEIMPYFEKLRDEVKTPILYVSHDASEVARLASTVIVLQAGRVQRQGPPSDVLSDPEVTPMGAAGAGSLLNARVLAHDADGITVLGINDLQLLVPQIPNAVGSELRVRIDAKDVMLATAPPQAISALNILPATLAALRDGQGPGMLAQLDLAGTKLLARVTRRSAKALALREGMPVFAIVKAVSIPREAIGG